MLYALLMAAIFSLVLQFYFNRQVNNQRVVLHHEKQVQAYSMAVLTKDTMTSTTGQMTFHQGHTRYEKKGQVLKVEVQLEGSSYQFNFYLNSKKD